MKNIRKTEWAYLAGFLDGEGSFLIERAGYARPTKSHPRGRVQLRPVIKAVNTDGEVIKWITSLLERAKIKHYCRFYDRGKNKRTYIIEVRNFEEVLRLIAWVKPFLVIKSKAAGVVESYICIRKEKQRKHKSAAYGEEEYERYNSIKQRGYRFSLTSN